MSAYLMKGYFHLPSQHKPFQDGLGLSLLIGAQKRLGIELPLRVPNEHPTDGDWWQSVVIPHSGFARQFDRTCGRAIPSHADALPDGAWIGEPLDQGGLTRSLEARTPIGSRFTNRSRIRESRIQA